MKRIDIFNKPAKYWQIATDGRVQCLLCPRQCRLAEGQFGFCYTRQNYNGQMILPDYGRTSGFCIDPIEKKPLYHFYPGNPVLSFGTIGCNLGCQYCQNWQISRARDSRLMSEKADPIQVADLAQHKGCSAVAFTYNDPVVFAEYAMDIADACHQKGVKTIAVTAGYISDIARNDFFSKMDAVNVDLKGFSEEFYQKYTLSHLAPVLKTLKMIKNQTDAWLEITYLLIPDANDSESDLHAMTEWISCELGTEVPLHFSAFHPDYRILEKRQTSLAILQKARGIALSKGLKYVYIGNCFDKEGSKTFCHACGHVLIDRHKYEIRQYKISDKKCPSCGALCAGYFQRHPGDWGNRRFPVNLA